MSIDSIHIYLALLVGAGATLFMDIWALVARKFFKLPSANYCLVGRWLSHMPTGKFFHSSITASERRFAECATGWVFHYVVGVAYVFLLVIPTSGRWLDRPTLIPALLVGIGTLVMPCFIMQPSFGLGIAGAPTANPMQARLRSLMSHMAYGTGLYLAALLLSQMTFG